MLSVMQRQRREKQLKKRLDGAMKHRRRGKRLDGAIKHRRGEKRANGGEEAYDGTGTCQHNHQRS